MLGSVGGKVSRVVLVEDNPRLAGLLLHYLSDAGYDVRAARGANEFRRLALQAKADLYIVDLGLPDGDGVQEIMHRRALGDTTPILVITARANISDRVAGLDGGADDYLVKPFDHVEFLARTRALLRRHRLPESSSLQIGRLSISLKDETVLIDGALLPLRPTERSLLCLLAKRFGHVVAKDSIEGALYSLNTEVSGNAVEQAVSRLRSALKRAEAELQIKTIWGVGYLLERMR